MKNVNFFIIALFAFFSSVFSQDSKEKEKWLIRIGAHDINYYPIKSPFKDFFIKDNNSFNPIISNIELEHNIKKHIGLYLDASVGMVDNNRWKIENIFFVKLTPGINLYIFPNSKFDPYLRLGGGFHKFNGYQDRELRISETKYFKTNRNKFFILDGGLGVNFWIVSNFGLNIQSTYNQVFAYQSSDFLNFWKHNIGVVFRFGNLKFLKYKNNDRVSIPSTVGVEEEKNKKIEVENKKEDKNFTENKICCQENLDQDHDGVLDKEDLCPNQFGLKKFRGCPDTDLDNIPDNEDQCPKKFGKKENQGCPDVAFRPILFDKGRFSLSNHFLNVLDQIAEMMINGFPSYKFYIDGYTAFHGKNSKTLSIKRANVVFEALVSRGVDPSRIEIRGFGAGKKNKKKKGKGRRVEITIKK
ncbi:OmpA family protein [Blattabacterium cuenoti]|uniref:OmpA family protein n=1 Tax=Blattabacterium cuenoti TaxID=1653831 RepID=UPI00163C17FC|nr:OmpA family protein [Blattabacterium cuenoti]